MNSAAIIGAGAAGLAAAEVLLNAGAKVTLFEAGPKAGGRVRALEGFADVAIELGAEEIHGAGNFLHQMAVQNNVGILSHSTAADLIRFDGKLYGLEDARNDPLIRKAIEWIGKLAHYDGSARSIEEQMILEHFPARVRHYLDSRLGVEHGTTVDRLSVLGFDQYEVDWERREKNFTVNGPYLSVLQKLSERTEGSLRLNTPIRRVVVNEGGICCETDKGGKIQADAVIVTASVLALRAGIIQFAPNLPADFLECLGRISMDGGMKVILKFSERFWPDGMYFLHADGFLPQYWSSTKGKSSNPRCLTAFIGGARFEKLKQLEVDPVRFALEELNEVFGNRIASSRFEEGFVADWSADPYIGGLYTYTGLSEMPGDRASLEDIIHGRLTFAGEAIDTVGYHGTVHGAISSGRRAAERILELRNVAER